MIHLVAQEIDRLQPVSVCDRLWCTTI